MDSRLPHQEKFSQIVDDKTQTSPISDGNSWKAKKKQSCLFAVKRNKKVMINEADFFHPRYVIEM